MNLTIAEATPLLAFVVAILGLWWRVETRISAGAVKAQAKADAVEADLARYKTEVADNYVKVGYLKDVEGRLGARLDKIVDELHGMRGDFQEAIVKIASAPKRRGS